MAAGNGDVTDRARAMAIVRRQTLGSATGRNEHCPAASDVHVAFLDACRK